MILSRRTFSNELSFFMTGLVLGSVAVNGKFLLLFGFAVFAFDSRQDFISCCEATHFISVVL